MYFLGLWETCAENIIVMKREIRVIAMAILQRKFVFCWWKLKKGYKKIYLWNTMSQEATIETAIFSIKV